ncbi:MAG: virulence RhuM family protein [Prevotella sp.]|nr:virulence RhuM family protein [Prevotella sp.]
MAEFERADVRKDFMGLTTWTGAVPKKTDAEIAKNYLSQGRGYDAGRGSRTF